MKKYLLDTNAYFKVLCFLGERCETLDSELQKNINDILKADCYISRITLIEIISVIGKYSRGSASLKRWKNKEIAAWIKLTRDITCGRSKLFSLKTIDFSDSVFRQAELFVEHALKYNFGSMDAFLASTAIVEIAAGNEVIMITEDKSLKAAMGIAGVLHSDLLKNLRYMA
jgi:predicted nucleic acid-binding protein